MFNHEHPLDLIDLWAEQLQHEEEYDEEEDENLDLTAQQNFQCFCDICDKNIEWVHRYYYKCSQCNYVSHKFCAELPETLEDICHVGHTMCGTDVLVSGRYWECSICGRESGWYIKLRYYCSLCYFNVDIDCITKMLRTNIIHHPSHKHPLVYINKEILCMCDACGKEHKGIFYHCPKCAYSFIHSHCAFLPKQLHIQHTTNDFFSHIHPLSLAYSFPYADQKSKFFPLCRVCNKKFTNQNLWIYKCEKCIYYTHLDCATSRNEPFMSILTSPGTLLDLHNICAFLPKEITHASHPNHLLSRVQDMNHSLCRMCAYGSGLSKFAFSCHSCDDFHLHTSCALLVPETTMHKCDKHPMKLRYYPVENHKSEYFCEICEGEFDPNYPFYHCDECMQSVQLVLRQYFSMKHMRMPPGVAVAEPFIGL
ncbi:uncharacterized protein LOC143632326 [Bidens hawaiensis]|uniref:uncharacterized protein LOC143632326 n=1 Tax=Bidens hawaiensis TaxID=980011 RepID=UPI00404B17C7